MPHDSAFAVNYQALLCSNQSCHCVSFNRQLKCLVWVWKASVAVFGCVSAYTSDSLNGCVRLKAWRSREKSDLVGENINGKRKVWLDKWWTMLYVSLLEVDLKKSLDHCLRGLMLLLGLNTNNSYFIFLKVFPENMKNILWKPVIKLWKRNFRIV